MIWAPITTQVVHIILFGKWWPWVFYDYHNSQVKSASAIVGGSASKPKSIFFFFCWVSVYAGARTPELKVT